MQSMIGQNFESLEQRILYYYLVTMPEFSPCACGDVSQASQQAMFDFLMVIPESFYKDPTLIGLKATPDAWYPDFALNKTNPDLIKQMRKAMDKLNKLYLNLIAIGQAGTLVEDKLAVPKAEVRFAKSTLAQFEALGLASQVEAEQTVFWSDSYPQMMPAFKYLADHAREGIREQNSRSDTITTFRRGLLGGGDVRSIAVVFEKLLSGNDAYARLVHYLEAHGYWQASGNIHDIRLDWIKNDGKPELEVRSPEAATNYWGLSVTFDYRRKNQIGLAMRLPKYKVVLEEFDTLSDTMKEIIITHTKHCDGCRYCVQTDKTGTRPLAAIPVTYHDRKYKLCPLYPVWGYQWTTIDDALVDQIITILDCVDEIYIRKGVI